MIEEVKDIRIEEYDYELPDERIAKFPLTERDSSKLLVYDHGKVSEKRFDSLPSLLPPGSLMVFNNTRVIQARLHFRKETGALIEVFCLEPLSPGEYVQMFAQTERCMWLCMIGNLKKWKEGTLQRVIEMRGKKVTLSVTKATDAPRVTAAGTTYCTSQSADVAVEFSWKSDDGTSVTFAELLDAVGELPIPPYLNRETQESDLKTYQTVYSKVKGSVAAPTAGLHFTERVLSELQQRGVEKAELTLHVGASTFKPVKSEHIAGHEMHSEYIVVPRSVVEQLIAHEGDVTAVGTTSVRTLESLYYIGVLLSRNPDASETELHVPQWMPYEEEYGSLTVKEALQLILDWLERNELQALHTTTQIMIAPGYTFRIVQRIVTNFHQPKSTLLLLVSAFLKGDWRKVYDFALENGFRFLSYGDSSLLMP